MEARTAHQLIERETELAQLESALAQAARGQGQLIVLEAAAGLGKTRLVEAALMLAAGCGMAGLSARGTGLEQEFAFGVVRQLLEPRLAAAGEQQRAALFEGAAVLSRPLFTGVAEDSATADPAYATLHGLYWLVSNLAAEQPLLLALDDVHWADTPSLRFLGFLEPRLAELPVALLVALRSGDPGSERPELLALTTAAKARALRPLPLSEAAVARVVGESLEAEPAPSFAAACHAVSAGNPFYLHALLRELKARGIEPTAAATAAMRRMGPRAISRAVLLRLSSIDADAPVLARAVAVLGDGAGLCEAAALAGLEEPRAAGLCDLLVRAAILRRTERLEFVHPIVRESVYADLAPRERAAAHARAARALADAGASPERVAAQLLEADPEGDPWVVDHLREAARHAVAHGAPEVAARYLRRALAEPAADALRAGLLLELGSASAAAGERDALERLKQAFELAREPDVLARAALELANVLSLSARPAEAVEVIERGLDELAEGPIGLRRPLEAFVLLQAHTTLAVRRLVLHRLEAADSDSERLDDQPEVLAALAVEKAENTGPAADAVRLATRALEHGRLLERQSLEAPPVYFAAAALAVAGRGDSAERYLARVLEDTRRFGSARGFAVASGMRGLARWRRGNLPGAEADLYAFFGLASEVGLDVAHPFGVGLLATVLLERGEREAAARTLATLDPASCDRDAVLFQVLRAARARHHLVEGRPRQALEEALAIAEWARSWGARHDAWTHWRPLAALAHAASGEHEQAAAVAAEALARARDFGADDYLGIALCSAGMTARREADIPLFEEAVRVLERSQARLEHARALVLLGAALRRANRRTEARAPLVAGAELALACGASPLVTHASEELEATGAKPRQLSDRDELTPSERRIAQMAAEGRSNREIAQALFVTPKTVETHLSNAFRKLGIGSRRELAARLERESV